MKGTTSVDVARVAGVSTKTVSRVFNDEPHVSDDVRQRVRAAAAHLNYQPNAAAQALVRRRSHLIGLVYERPSPSYVVELQMGVLHRLEGERYRLVVIPVGSITERAGEVAGLVRSAGLEGVVLAPPASDHPVVLGDLANAGVAVARIAPTRMLDQGYITQIDDVAAAQEIAAHLIALGHQRIGIVKGDPSHPSVEARMIGYRQAFDAAGMEMRPDWIDGGLYSLESGVAAGRRLLDRADRPGAILAMNDEMAVGTMIAARELGIALPDELSVAGFDDAEPSRIVWPRLTTVRQPVFEMAASATDMLLKALEGGDTGRRSDHPHELMVRESTAAPTGGR
jgi:LacI family transcriptional regulator